MKKFMLYTLTAEYYSAIKRSDFLTHATAWMNLEHIMFSEVNQAQKDK